MTLSVKRMYDRPSTQKTPYPEVSSHPYGSTVIVDKTDRPKSSDALRTPDSLEKSFGKNF